MTDKRYPIPPMPFGNAKRLSSLRQSDTSSHDLSKLNSVTLCKAVFGCTISVRHIFPENSSVVDQHDLSALLNRICELTGELQKRAGDGKSYRAPIRQPIRNKEKRKNKNGNAQ